MSHAVIEIDTTQFVHNLHAIKDHLKTVSPNTKFCLPVKGNAYGHGLIKIAKTAEPHVDYIAVSSLMEAQILKNNSITKPILIFGAFNDDDVADMVRGNFEITISSQYKLDQIQAFCTINNLTAKVHVKIDTGMHRVGMKPKSSYSIIDKIVASKELQLVGIYSHLACADEEDPFFTNKQISDFSDIAQYVKTINSNIICHLANSAGLCYHKNSYFDMIRPGILSYGYFPSSTPTSKQLKTIKPCFSVKSKAAFLKSVDKHQGISYNHTYITSQSTYIVTVPVGYGDGYRRILSNRGSVLINQKLFTVSGIICMDMFMVDIGRHNIVDIGDEVVLLGKQGNLEISAFELADKCQTNVYEILSGFNERIPRAYIK